MTRKEALEVMRKNMPTDRSLPIYEALQTLIPELAESEDERVRKALIDGIRQIRCKNGVTQEQMLAWLEKQKSAEWSEEFLRLMGITISQDGNQVCVLLGENLAEGIAGFGDTLADAVEEFKKEWRQFDRFRKATWKPSKEQMNALKVVAHGYPSDDIDAIESLLNDLQKLL